VRESPGVLGRLYRDLSNEPAYKSFLQNEYAHQVLMQWELDKRIMSKVSSELQMFEYLHPVYSRIVLPMERKIRGLMFLFRQHTEAALFASDLKFHISA
jgi:hypothetical protein